MSKLAVVPPADPAAAVAAATDPAAVPAIAAVKKSPAMLIAAGALVVGGAIGALVIAPRMAGSTGGAGAAAGATKSHGGGAHGKAEEGQMIEIDNLIVNPDGARGLHYLMVTVAIEVEGKEAQAWINSHEHVVRDMIITAIGRESLASLCQPDIRERLKLTLADTISGLVPGHPSMTIYLPQFVVQ